MTGFSRSYRLFFFTFGVLLFLMRPFIGYAVTASSGNPASPVLSLQRLVKKKEEHLETDFLLFEAGTAESLQKPLFRILNSLIFTIAFFSGKFAALRAPKAIPHFSEIAPDNHCYRLHSRYRI